jgi:iron-sulfur cluster insertion protein
MIDITEAAATKLKGLITPKEVVRIAIEGGGCAGFQYRFGLVPKEDTFQDDYVLDKLGVQLFVDSISMSYLDEATIDYEEDSFMSMFKIKNAGAKSTCGCGNSFN